MKRTDSVFFDIPGNEVEKLIVGHLRKQIPKGYKLEDFSREADGALAVFFTKEK